MIKTNLGLPTCCVGKRFCAKVASDPVAQPVLHVDEQHLGLPLLLGPRVRPLQRREPRGVSR